MALHAVKHYSTYMEEGRLAEQQGKIDQAVDMYEQAIKQKPLDEDLYQRLMIIFRKQKAYQKELKIIDKGINIFQNNYDEKAQRLFGSNKKLQQAGKALLKSLTPKGIKSHNQYPEPIPKWRKRRDTVLKKINPSKRK